MMLKLMEKDEQEMEITRNKVKISKKNLEFMDKEAITLFYFILFSLYGLWPPSCYLKIEFDKTIPEESLHLTL